MGSTGWARQALWGLIAASTLFRLVVAAGLGPGNDEAYHYLFATHPDWSYFDHPPMLALVESAGLSFVKFRASVFALRLGFVALFAGSTWLMARLTSRFFGPVAGLFAAFALNATGYYGVAAGTFALPDGPLVFFWLLTLDRLARAVDTPKGLWPWVGVGLAWGGAMLSKYHAVFLPAGTFAFVVLDPGARHWLRRPGPYLAFAVGLLLFTPVIAWNATHGWASFSFQAGRAVGSLRFRPDTLLASIGGQALYLCPWIWIFLVIALVRPVRRWWRGEARSSERFLLCQALVPLAIVTAVSSVRAVLPHWSLVGFLAVFPMLGRDWAEMLAVEPRSVAIRVFAAAALSVGLTGLVFVQTRSGIFQWGSRTGLGLVPARHDPTADFYGWDQVANELRRRRLLEKPGTFIVTNRWYHSGHIAFALGEGGRVTCYNRRHAQNFAYWSRPGDWLGRDAIYVGVNQSSSEVDDLSRWFRSVEPLGVFPVMRGGVPIRKIHLYRFVDQVAPFPFAEGGVQPPRVAATGRRPQADQGNRDSVQIHRN